MKKIRVEIERIIPQSTNTELMNYELNLSATGSEEDIRGLFKHIGKYIIINDEIEKFVIKGKNEL